MKSRLFAASTLSLCLLSSSCKEDEEQKQKITDLEDQVSSLVSEKEFLSSEIQRVTPKPGSLGPQEAAAMETQVKELRDQIAKHALVEAELARVKQEHAELVAKVTQAQPALLGIKSDRSSALFDDQGAIHKRFANAVVTIEGNAVSGIGFVASADGKKFLYTAARVLSGNTKLTIRCTSGTALTKFGALEAAEGADIVRLEILDEVADVVELMESSKELGKDSDLVSLSVTQGANEVVAAKGRYMSTTGDMLDVDSGLIQSGSGAPIIDPYTGKVLGMTTDQYQERNDIWSDASNPVTPMRMAAKLNKDWKWKSVKIGSFLAESAALVKHDELTRLALAMASVRSAEEEGISTDQVVAGSLTASSIFDQYKTHSLVVALMKLKPEPGAKRMSSGAADMKKKLRSVVSAMLSEATRGKEAFKPGAFTWYHRSQAKASVAARDEAIKALNDSLETME